MNRVDRLHAILTHLQSKKRVTASELADRFKLSLRTVYRDVKALEESGVPIIGESGIGYSVMEGYRLPPVMFTPEEASALLLGSKLVRQFTDSSIRKHFDAAMFKIKAVLRSTDKEEMEELDQRIEIRSLGGQAAGADQLYLNSVREAIVRNRVVRLDYYSFSNQEVSERDVEPVGLFYYGSAWHFIGWCRLREGYRDFRMDRVRKLVAMDEQFESGTHPTLVEYIDQLRQERQLHEVVVGFDPSEARYMQHSKYYFGFVSEEEREGRVYMRFLTMQLEGFCRWLLSYTNMAWIESPVSLNDRMRGLIQELAEHYR